MGPKRVVAVVGSALALVVWAAAPALAAPQRLASDPEPGAELHQAPERVTLTFSEPLDESSEIRVFDDCDRRLDDGKTRIDLIEMSVGIDLTPSGTYTVAYVAVGVTGTSQESYTFTVLHSGPSCDGAGGHEGHGDQDGDGDGHDDHGGDGDGGGHDGHGGGGDDGHDGAATHHEGSTATGHDGHDGRGGGHGDHHGKQGNGKQGGGEGPGGEGGTPPIAAAADDLLPDPSGAAVALALGIALLFGVAGGWVLRMTGPS